MTPQILDVDPFKAYILVRKAGWSQTVKFGALDHPGLVMDDDLRAEARDLIKADPDKCAPQFQITNVISGKLMVSFDGGAGNYTLERGSSASRLLLRADMTLSCPEDTLYYCLYPQSPDPICYHRDTLYVSEGGSILVEPKAYTRHIWAAEGSVAGHPAPFLVTVLPGEERVFQCPDGMLGCLLWHESK
jgi:hypothetical protein